MNILTARSAWLGAFAEVDKHNSSKSARIVSLLWQKCKSSSRTILFENGLEFFAKR
jgi:hypothetical protein